MNRETLALISLLALVVLMMGYIIQLMIIPKLVQRQLDKKTGEEPKEADPQLRPKDFEESSMELKPPPDMPECGSLHVLHDKKKGVYISFWEVSPEQIEQIKNEGGIWLGIIASAHPPVFLTITKPIEQEEQS